MKFSELVHLVADEPVFETGMLLVGGVDAVNLRRQLSRWTRNGRLLQLRRGLYALAPPWQKRRPHPFLVANRLAPGSYVSGHSALAQLAGHSGVRPPKSPAAPVGRAAPVPHAAGGDSAFAT